MSLTLDPEIAAALAPMAESGFAPPAVGDIAGRRAMWEPIIGAASAAQPIPADVTTSEHHATADDGAQIGAGCAQSYARGRWRRAVLHAVSRCNACSRAATALHSCTPDVHHETGRGRRPFGCRPTMRRSGSRPMCERS
jgi:hypothetical protein